MHNDEILDSHLSASDSSILTVFACVPCIRQLQPLVCERLFSRLKGKLAKEIALLLTHEVDADNVSEKASKTAEAMQKWVNAKTMK